MEGRRLAGIRAELVRLLQLTWPVVLGQVGLVLMGVEDLVMIGPLGPTALAAVGMGNLWSFGVSILGMGVLRGVDPVFSQAHGSGDDARGALALARALVLGLGLSLPVMGLHHLAAPGLVALSQPPEAIPLAVAYVDVVLWGTPALLLFGVLSQYLQARGQVLLPTLVILAGNVVNISLNAVFLYGLGWGVVGCGWSTVLGRVLSLLGLLGLAWGLVLRELPRPSRVAVLEARALGRLLALGGPVGLQYGVEVWAFNAAGLMVGWLGMVPFAAHQITLNISSLVFMLPFGLSIAAATRVGNLLGASLPWAQAAWTAIGASAAGMALCAGGLWLGAPLLAGLYTDEPAVLAITAAIIPVMAAFQVFDGVQAVAAGVLRGAGDTRTPALVNLLGFWGVGLPVGYLLGVMAERPQGVWYGLVAGLGAVALLLVLRVRRVIQQGGRQHL